MAEGTAKNYAIEHAEYMAKAAEAYMSAEGRYTAVQIDSNTPFDARRALCRRIYEFRKRAEYTGIEKARWRVCRQRGRSRTRDGSVGFWSKAPLGGCGPDALLYEKRHSYRFNKRPDIEAHIRRLFPVYAEAKVTSPVPTDPVAAMPRYGHIGRMRRIFHPFAIMANAALIAVIVVGVGLYATSHERGTLVRNSLLAHTATLQDFAWTPANVPADFVIDTQASDIFDGVAPQLREATDLETAVRIVEHLNDNPRKGKPIQRGLEETYRRTRTGAGYCADYTQLFTAFGTLNGLWVREWGFGLDGFGSGHAFSEIWSAELEQWVFIDPFNGFYVTAEGRPLAVSEFRDRLEQRKPITVQRIGTAFRFRSDERALEYYARATDYFFLFWGNNVFAQDTSPLLRFAGDVSRSAEVLISIVTGIHPRIRPVPTGTNADEIAALGTLRFVLLASLGIVVALSALLVTQLYPAMASRKRSIS